MGWFENQIQDRRDADQQLLEDSFIRIAGVVMGEKDAQRIGDARIITKSAIDEILKYYHCKPTEIPEDVKSDSPGPEESAIKNAAAAAVRAAVEKLPEKDRLLVYRRYYYMQSVAQIAAETGLSERAAEGRLYRIRQKLAEMLKGYANE